MITDGLATVYCIASYAVLNATKGFEKRYQRYCIAMPSILRQMTIGIIQSTLLNQRRV